MSIMEFIADIKYMEMSKKLEKKKKSVAVIVQILHKTTNLVFWTDLAVVTGFVILEGMIIFILLYFIFIQKHVKMIMLWFLQGSVANKVFFKSVEYDV